MGLLHQITPTSVESRNFLSFCFPSNVQLDDKSSLNEWIERMIFIYEDLKWLLSLSVLEFWNQIIFDTTWSVCLDSFLFNAPRAYDLKNVPENCKVALGRVSKLFLLVIKRMSIIDEDDELQFSSDEFGEIIYENFLFDAAKLFDISGIYYRPENKNILVILEDIIGNIFKYQPNYYDDLSNAVENMISTINNIEEKLIISQSLSSNKHAKGNSVNGREAQDMILFIYDMAKTFSSFIQVFPGASNVFFNLNVIGRFASICESIIPEILKVIEVNRKKFKYIAREIEKCLAKFMDKVIQEGFIKKLKDNHCENKEELSAEYVGIMDSISQYPNFLESYCSLGTILDDFKTIETVNCIDISSLEYMKNMVSCVVSESGSEKVLHQLRELLPTKGEDYITKCIDKYGANIDVIVNNVMEGNVPEEVAINKKVTKQIKVPNKEILEDNKEHVALLKETLFPATLDSDDDEEMYSNLYDDEYDDTYDSQNVAALDADSADELGDLTSRRKFTIPDALRRIGDVSSSESEEEETNQNASNGAASEENDRDNGRGGWRGANRGFRGNQRGSRGNRGTGRGFGRGRGGRGRGGTNGGGTNGGGATGGDEGGTNRGGINNAGRGRGRGRAKKHNRKSMADKKHSKGMMPF